jgi:serine/threonine protein kinase
MCVALAHVVSFTWVRSFRYRNPDMGTGPPECYENFNIHESDICRQDQKVDVWSLGCICSELLVWLREGRRGLKKYSRERGDETKRRDRNFRDGDAFHDCKKVLEVVKQIHSKDSESLNASDSMMKYIDSLVLEMFQPAEARSNSHQVWVRLVEILQISDKSLRAKKNVLPKPAPLLSPASNSSSTSSPPSLRQSYISSTQDTVTSSSGVSTEIQSTLDEEQLEHSPVAVHFPECNSRDNLSTPSLRSSHASSMNMV